MDEYDDLITDENVFTFNIPDDALERAADNPDLELLHLQLLPVWTYWQSHLVHRPCVRFYPPKETSALRNRVSAKCRR